MTTILDSNYTLKLSRWFDASPERVFDAWLSKQWGEWVPPRAATCVVTELEPIVGGKYHLAMTMPDGRSVEIDGVYREIVRPSRLALTWRGNYDGNETVIALTFVSDGDGTLMHMEQSGFAAEEMSQGYNSGWSGEGGSFDKLTRLLGA
jgi:uncharacterized protein YndB with AHSA1/START domain